MGKTSQSILTKEQQSFLKIFSQQRNLCRRFYLTGGTALAEFYLHHRYSEDIDLFSEEEFDIAPIRSLIKKTQRALGATSVDYQQYFGLHTFFFLFHRADPLKVDFNYYPFKRIEKGAVLHGVSVDSCYDIGVNKVHTIVMKPRSRDYIDLYFIIKKFHYPLSDLLKAAKVKFDWHIDAAQLGARLMQALETRDLPKMIIRIDHRQWRNFFLVEAKKLGEDILK